MIKLGYMAKRIALRSDWLENPNVHDIHAVSNCISQDFCDYADYWKHNGFWFFDSPAHIRDIACVNDVELAGTTLVYYRGHPQQFDADQNKWTSYVPEASIVTNVVPPNDDSLLGFDIVTYSMQNAPGCSPLSCNNVAKDVEVNEHCLITSLDDAIEHLEKGRFDNCEPGPYRIIAISSVRWPAAEESENSGNSLQPDSC